MITADADFDLLSGVNLLNNIGAHSDFQSFGIYRAHYNANKYDDIILKLILLLGNQNPNEGILRMLASLSVLGLNVPSISINTDNLSPKGKIFYLSLSLYGSQNKSTSVDEMARMIVNYLDSQESNTLMKYILGLADSNRRPLSKYTSEVFSKLTTFKSVDKSIKQMLLGDLVKQISYRRSSLSNSRSRTALDL
ncbi:MAG: hypothetical protein EOO61_14200 [Hymenobacter sp.]|nr:MAG: hypothetical protein EOO61_14200 [Hymenobacter sp.]